jgi:phage tail sheath protein FI
MAGYLHGIQQLESLDGPKGANAPSTAVVGLVGVAPNFLGSGAGHPAGRPVLVTSDRDAAAFGPRVPGYDIPGALATILSYGFARIAVIDVFDPELHSSEVSDEAVALGEAGEAALANVGIISAEVKLGGSAVVDGEDYTLDRATGRIRRLRGGSIPPNAALTVSYVYGDPSKVTGTETIGGVDAAGLRHGMQAILDVPTSLGCKPRILLTPSHAAGSSVAAALVAMAERTRAHAFLDVPPGATVAQCIEGRVGEGAIDLGTDSARVVLCYPYVEVMDPATETKALEPFSQHLAGLACSVDALEGFWVSPSNHSIPGVVGLETPVQWSLSDPTSEANRLNEVGIVTAVRPPNRGFTVWGNRSAAWPSQTHPINFISVRVVADYLQETAERVLMSYMDRPLNKPTLNSAREDMLGVMEDLKRKGALIGGSFIWPEDDNPLTELSLGNATYEMSFLGPLPIDKITVKGSIDTSWLRSLYGGQ